MYSISSHDQIECKSIVKYNIMYVRTYVHTRVLYICMYSGCVLHTYIYVYVLTYVSK